MKIHTLLTPGPGCTHVQSYTSEEEVKTAAERFVAATVYAGIIHVPANYSTAMQLRDMMDDTWYNLWQQFRDMFPAEEHLRPSLRVQDVDVMVQTGGVPVDKLAFDTEAGLTQAEHSRKHSLVGTTFRLGEETASRLARAITQFPEDTAVQIFLRGLNLLDLVCAAKQAGFSTLFYGHETHEYYMDQRVDLYTTK